MKSTKHETPQIPNKIKTARNSPIILNSHCFSLRSKGVPRKFFFGRCSFFAPKAQKMSNVQRIFSLDDFDA
jgi:hypothetical protein